MNKNLKKFGESNIVKPPPAEKIEHFYFQLKKPNVTVHYKKAAIKFIFLPHTFTTSNRTMLLHEHIYNHYLENT